MTTQQIVMWSCAYLIELGGVIYFTRATAWRIMAALAGGLAAGLLGMGAIALCEALGWWQVPFAATPYFVPLFYLGLSISLTPVYLVTWRVARRFHWRGVAVCLVVVGIVGPPRDYLYAALYPEWMVFAKGVAPVLADSVAYLGLVIVGHVVMWSISGPASDGHLARQPSAA